MIFGILTLLIALSIAGVAAWFSIAGLMAIFSASASSIAIMAGVLEVAKLLVASWLYRHWKTAGIMMKTYLISAVVVLMVITSMGIFGYLSKAHLDQQQTGNDAGLAITRLEAKIERERGAIRDAETVVAQLDQAVQTLIDYDRIRGPEGSLAVRRGQQEERDQLTAVINEADERIAAYEEELFPLKQEVMNLELEVGPLKYVAELVWGDQGHDMIDQAVRLFILMFVFVFDPLAVIMVIAANQTLLRHGIDLEGQHNDEPDPEKDELRNKVLELEDKLAKKPKATRAKTKTVEVEKIVEVPVEKIVERPVEKIVEKIVEKPDAKILKSQQTKIQELEEKIAKQDKMLADKQAPEQPKQKIALATKPTKMQAIAKELANSELNREDLTEQDILDMLAKSTEADVRHKLGFWASPLPAEDVNNKPSNFKRK